jgi:hypothetical protein
MDTAAECHVIPGIFSREVQSGSVRENRLISVSDAIKQNHAFASFYLLATNLQVFDSHSPSTGMRDR